jgi:hypothetical protein
MDGGDYPPLIAMSKQELVGGREGYSELILDFDKRTV